MPVHRSRTTVYTCRAEALNYFYIHPIHVHIIRTLACRFANHRSRKNQVSWHKCLLWLKPCSIFMKPDGHDPWCSQVNTYPLFSIAQFKNDLKSLVVNYIHRLNLIKIFGKLFAICDETSECI
jgi:hypothetical protein